MRRIRIVFAVLAVALLVPTGLLVRRALQSVEVEQAARHRTVAERIFDEMERSLSAFLAREEERPFGHYRFYFTPEGAVVGVGALARSPLADPPDRDFVVGYFQVDPDGSVHSPLRPRDEAAARASGDYRPTPAVERSENETLAVVSAHWAAPARSAAAKPSAVGAKRKPALEKAAQAPGTTVSLRETRKDAKRERGGASDDVLEEEVAQREVFASAYDAIQSLNRGAVSRASRSQKVVEQRAAPEAMAQAEAPEARMQAAAPRPATVGDEAGFGFAEEPLEGTLERDGPAALGGARESAPAAEQRRTLRIALDPLNGRAIDERHLLLYRTVLVDDQGFRQGLVLDIPELTEFLRRETFGGRELLGASLAFTAQPEGAISGDEESSYAYRHRFAEPFDDLAVALHLAPLPGASGARSVYLLSILLLLAGSAGLFALYRMVGVTVGFAERRSNFVAAVSHELKTPLTAIRMYAEMLRDGIVPSENKRQEYYGTITSESERLSRLINNVLEFSRLEKGNRQMNLVAGPLAPVLEEMAGLLRPHAEREGFSLQVESDPDLPPVRYDRDALLQVLFNLVDNAIKYARDAPQRMISVECRRRDGGVAVLVRDRGPGVAPRNLGRLFEPFYRGETELTRRTKGTGIGLALVKGLVERMDAGISGRNREGGGFEVSIDFRVSPA